MRLAEFFSFLPFGKYAFYIWFSYLITFTVIAVLFIRTRIIRINTFKQLHIKFTRENDKKTK